MSANEQPNDETIKTPAEGETRPHAAPARDGGNPVPLFLRDGSDGRKGNAQDEKDEIGE